MKFRSFMESDPFDYFPNKSSLIDKPRKAKSKKSRTEPEVDAWGIRPMPNAKVSEPTQRDNQWDSILKNLANEPVANPQNEFSRKNDAFKALARANPRSKEIGQALQDLSTRAIVRNNVKSGMSPEQALDDLLIRIDHQPMNRAKLAQPMRPPRLSQPRDYLPPEDQSSENNPYITKQKLEPVPYIPRIDTALPSPTFGHNTGGGRRIIRSPRNA